MIPRFRSRRAEQERLAAAAEDENRRLRAEVELLRGAVEALPLGVVVRDRSGHELLRNGGASSPTDDIYADALVADAVGALMEKAAAGDDGVADGVCRETVDLHGPPRRSVDLAAQRLPSGAVIAVIQDASERRRVDTLRRDFVDNVNHELRTPIGALGVLVDALEGQTDPEVIARLVERMGREVRRAHHLVEDWLELSSIERHTATAREPVDLASVIVAAVSRVEALAERAQVTVDTAGASPATVTGNRAELTSAVANLLDNAVKYSPPGSSVEVAVETHGGIVDVTVRDHGVGIPAKDLDRIFERFYRVDRARDRTTGGSGLGLAIVRHVALNHGGEVLVSSVEGEGSTFRLRLQAGT